MDTTRPAVLKGIPKSITIKAQKLPKQVIRSETMGRVALTMAQTAEITQGRGKKMMAQISKDWRMQPTP